MLPLKPIHHRHQSVIENIHPRRMLLHNTVALIYEFRTPARRRDIKEKKLAPTIGIHLLDQRLVPVHQLGDDFLCIGVCIAPASTIITVRQPLPRDQKKKARNKLINANPKPKHRIISPPRRSIGLTAIRRLEGLDLRHHIRVLGFDDGVVDGCAADCEVVG